MASKKSIVAPPEAPGADTAAPQTTPGRKKRYSFYPDGSDYVLVAVQTDEHGEPLPNGALSAVPGVRKGPEGEDLPLRFESAQEAERWLRAAGAQCEGMRVICVRMMWSMRVLVQSKPMITVTKDARFEKSRDAEDDEPDESADSGAQATESAAASSS